MSVLFTQTMRAMRADHPKYLIAGKLLILLVMAIWGYWFFKSSIVLYETSAACRLELRPAPMRIESEIQGSVASHTLELGREVQRGEVLLTLDGRRLSLAQQTTAAESALLETKLTGLRRRLEAEAEALLLLRKSARLKRVENEAQVREVESSSRQAVLEQQAARALAEKGLLPSVESARLDSEEKGLRARLEAEQVRVERESVGQNRETALLQARIYALEGEIAETEARVGVLQGRLAEFDFQLARLQLTAPSDGVLGAVGRFPAGSFLEEGETVATLLPRGHLTAVADFQPHQALGRIGLGQSARIKLDGFPWTQFGYLPARVERIAGEVHGQGIRVEMALEDAASYGAPLQHGQPGLVEIEVERVSPAQLLWRMLGKVALGEQEVAVDGSR
ncbi:HlyD family secretion protein [Acanthopleuribacter pedis]|uniref:HlyD family efflux transporter periplasmic adaptor subunit n=1 Tax=Acanthopleuribacter pedis TaxID=442870 RepID=A0A8J7QFA8_9BACT|nr:HlyD family efflux transporter periplasmic adaptor subunit [Acanthopleuribacter pedis]MBO1318785.1 HlyD family efflux transporter periplasmic adaptor subunit [Acanthopleuribacter pedis]